MFQRISNSWELVKASYAVLKSDKELILFPILSTIGMILVTIAFAIPLFASGLIEAMADDGEPTTGQTIAGIALGFMFYFTTYTVIIFSNVALVGAAMIRLRGGDPTVGDGFRIASQHIGAILGYAAISATVGMILNAMRNEDNILSKIVASFLGTAWNLITFMVIPVLVIENVGPIEAIKRSGSLLKKTWGEQVAASFGMGMISFLIILGIVFLIGAPVMLIASATNSGLIMALGIGLIVILVVSVSLFFSALNGIFQAALYNYATEGNAGDFFDNNMMDNAFKQK